MIYELKETGRATALFAGWQDSVVWSALQGVMGKIYVDFLEKPESGAVMLGDFCFLSGKPESEVISGALANSASEEVILVPQNCGVLRGEGRESAPLCNQKGTWDL